MMFGDTDMGGGNGGDGGTGPPQLSALNIMPMGGAWKELTSNGPRPPSTIIAPWRRPWIPMRFFLNKWGQDRSLKFESNI